MITEIETLYSRLEKLPMTPADRVLARARLEQAEAFAAAVHAVFSGLSRLVRGRLIHDSRHPDLHPKAKRRQDLWASDAL